MRNRILTLVLAGVALTGAVPSMAQSTQPTLPFLSPLFTDNMVLQRDRQDPIWGWSTPGDYIMVTCDGSVSTAVADSNGKWAAELPKRRAGGPYTVEIKGPGQSVHLKNVLFGDVWVCSGQSNMQFGMGNLANAQEEIAKADKPQIRLYMVNDVTSATPQDTAPAMGWNVCTPDSIAQGGWGGFSAVGYFFGRDLQDNLHIPIGLLLTTWGGTPAEAWTSEPALKKLTDFANVDDVVSQAAATGNETEDHAAQRADAWVEQYDKLSQKTPNPSDPAFDDSSWYTMKLPTPWQQAGMPNYNGVVWFRRSFTLTAAQTGHDVPLHMCQIDDYDCTWVNGVRVGGGIYAANNRNYVIPASALHEGKNVITIRVLDTGGLGGIYGDAKAMHLDLPDGTSIPLDGPWLYLPTTKLSDMGPTQNFWPPALQNTPTMLYNAMVNPLIPFGMKGVIWYQGEANGDRGTQYRTLLPAMIDDWRGRWGEDDFPFLIVQLAAFTATQPQPVDEPWAHLREAQSMTAHNVKNSGLAVAIDIGNADDIHPKNKQEVGRRLALIALHNTYHKKVEYSGPDFASMKVEDNRIRLTFTHVDGGLDIHGDKLTGFAIAGADKNFVWADAVVDGDTVIVSSTSIPNPVAVRYAWANNPVCNLYNKAGLPAIPFRTDQW